nr:MAG TPA: hypothetical protein [Caudoviricetes sp.]
MLKEFRSIHFPFLVYTYRLQIASLMTFLIIAMLFR